MVLIFWPLCLVFDLAWFLPHLVWFCLIRLSDKNMANPHILDGPISESRHNSLSNWYFILPTKRHKTKSDDWNIADTLFFFALGKNNIFLPPALLSSYCRKKWCRGGCQRRSHCVWLCGTYLQFPFRWFSQSALHHYFVRQANKLCSRPLQKNGDTRKIRLFSRLLWFASSVKCLCQKKKKSPTASVSLLPFAVGCFIYFVSVYF